tara:strand:+ start:3662 stop:4426 length:765 start_codon:yes stop_codon:yes gene_type:complete
MNNEDQQIIQLYKEKNMSTHEIAQKFNTYPNKINRVLKKHGVQLRGKGEAQKIALEVGRTEHPTKGKEMKDSTKLKISEKQGELWDNMTEIQRQERVENGKDSWNKKTASERQAIIKKAHEAVQEASRIGSKMENYLLQELIKQGFKIDFHKEHWLQNHKLQLDLFVPDLRAAIEIDGPSHFKPVWGMEQLIKNQKADRQKTGLILAQGLVLIRVKMEKKFSQRYSRQTLSKLLEILNEIKKHYPPQDERYFEL